MGIYYFTFFELPTGYTTIDCYASIIDNLLSVVDRVTKAIVLYTWERQSKKKS